MGRWKSNFAKRVCIIPIAFLAMSAWLAVTKASYNLQIIVAVAAIVIQLGVLLVWVVLVSMRAYSEAEPDPLKKLAESCRRNPHTLPDA